jgi:hypothetical protein
MLPADALRWSAPALADHPHGLGQRPRHRQRVLSMATAAREQHEVRLRHLGCTTLTRTAGPAGLLRLAPDPAGAGRAWRRRRPGLRRQPPLTLRRPHPWLSSRWQRQGRNASNEGGLAGGATRQPGQARQLLAQVGPPAPEDPCAYHQQATVDGLQPVAERALRLGGRPLGQPAGAAAARPAGRADPGGPRAGQRPAGPVAGQPDARRRRSRAPSRVSASAIARNASHDNQKLRSW